VSQQRPSGDDVLSTLEQLPPLRGVTFRGGSSSATFVRPGQSVVLQGVVATSRDLTRLLAAEPPTLYAILARTARDIAPFSADRSEREVALLPGTLLHLAETRTLAGVEVHLVVEVDPASPRLPDELPDRMAAELETVLAGHVAAAQDAPPARDRFVGDLA
jgi:hypothetical protein